METDLQLHHERARETSDKKMQARAYRTVAGLIYQHHFHSKQEKEYGFQIAKRLIKDAEDLGY